MRKIKCAIFDLDGTIFDSMHIWAKIDVDFLAKRGISVPDDYMKMIAPLGPQKAAEYTKTRFSLSESVEEIKQEWDDMSVKAYETVIGLKPGVKEILCHFRESGIKMAIATASKENLYNPALEKNGIKDFFDSVTTTSEVKQGKEFADIYEKAAEKMGYMPSECLVLEDIYEGLSAAKQAGFYTVGVYEKFCAYSEDKIMEKSDIYIHDFRELINCELPRMK